MDTCSRTVTKKNLDQADRQQEELFSIPDLLSLFLEDNDSKKIAPSTPETQTTVQKPLQKPQSQTQTFHRATLAVQRPVASATYVTKQYPFYKPVASATYVTKQYPFYKPIGLAKYSTQQYPFYKPVATAAETLDRKPVSQIVETKQYPDAKPVSQIVETKQYPDAKPVSQTVESTDSTKQSPIQRVSQQKLLDTISYIFLDEDKLEELEEVDVHTSEAQKSSRKSKSRKPKPSYLSNGRFGSRVGLASAIFAGGFVAGGISSWLVLSEQDAAANSKQQTSALKYSNFAYAETTNSIAKPSISAPEVDLPEPNFVPDNQPQEPVSETVSQKASKEALVPESNVLAATSTPLVQARLLTSTDLKGRSAWELTVMRNEIYARHGRRFKEQKLQRYFDTQSWYNPRYAPEEFPNSVLSPTELKNAIMIREYQRIHGLLLDP
ncbi:MAG: YARHG domain-containing protein [Fischerella sp.]|nr:YARHG domain-containing protein [Fischerella sp.]